MNTNMRRFAISMLSGSLVALGSTLAMADGVNNNDNTSQGESGHGTGCSNFAGGCHPSEVSSAHGAYQPTNNLGMTNVQPSATTAPSGSTPATTGTSN